MNETLNFIYEKQGSQQEILLYLHEWLSSFPSVTSRIRYRIPFYYVKSWICYLNPIGDQQVEIAFTRGNELSNEQGLLRSNGRKQVRGITFSRLQDIPEAPLAAIIQEAIILDATTPYGSKRSRKN